MTSELVALSAVTFTPLEDAAAGARAAGAPAARPGRLGRRRARR